MVGFKKKKKTCYIYVILISEVVLPTCNFTWQINKWFILLWVEYFHSVVWIKHKKLVEPMRFKDIMVVTTSHLFSPCYGELNAFNSLLSENGFKRPLAERTLVRRLEFWSLHCQYLSEFAVLRLEDGSIKKDGVYRSLPVLTIYDSVFALNGCMLKMFLRLPDFQLDTCVVFLEGGMALGREWGWGRA